jgi:hypothetical protein
MDSSKLCMTREHCLELQWNQMHKWNNSMCKKYVKEYLVAWKQQLEQVKIYIQNQRVMKTKE